MEGVKLMNRIDTKYVFEIRLLPLVLDTLRKYYKVVEVEGKRICKYETQYFDTTNFELYCLHHAGKLNRYKIRHRNYRDTGTGFLEIKFKNNKGRTIKTRTKCKESPAEWTSEQFKFLSDNQPYAPARLKPSLRIDYKRITLVSKASKERVTIDVELSFKTADANKGFERIAIAEVKQDSRASSAFVSAMKEHRIREGSISKYCMGIAETISAVKKNNFKQKLRNITKLNT